MYKILYLMKEIIFLRHKVEKAAGEALSCCPPLSKPQLLCLSGPGCSGESVLKAQPGRALHGHCAMPPPAPAPEPGGFPLIVHSCKLLSVGLFCWLSPRSPSSLVDVCEQWSVWHRDPALPPALAASPGTGRVLSWGWAQPEAVLAFLPFPSQQFHPHSL